MREHAQAESPRRPAGAADRRRTTVLAGLLAATAVVAAVAWTTRSGDEPTAAGTPTGSLAVDPPTSTPDLTPATAPAQAPALPADTTAAPELAPPLATAPTGPSDTPTTSETPGDEGTGATAPQSESASVSLDGTNPGLQAAFGAAADALAEAGLELVVNSGYRTPEHQRRLLDEALAEYGSYEEASRWVFEPERSMHVQGLAVDIGSGPAADWLQQHGAQYGICQTLDWEWWHFEWRQVWQDRGDCPPAVADPDDAPGVDVP